MPLKGLPRAAESLSSGGLLGRSIIRLARNALKELGHFSRKSVSIANGRNYVIRIESGKRWSKGSRLPLVCGF